MSPSKKEPKEELYIKHEPLEIVEKVEERPVDNIQIVISFL